MNPRGGEVPSAQTTPLPKSSPRTTPLPMPAGMLTPYMGEAIPTLKPWSGLEKILSHCASVSL